MLHLKRRVCVTLGCDLPNAACSPRPERAGCQLTNASLTVMHAKHTDFGFVTATLPESAALTLQKRCAEAICRPQLFTKL